jgi:shikimate kinase
MGSGKSSAGRMLAERCGFQFIDLDAEVEAEQRRTIAQIFSESGEDEFRRIESETLQRVLGRSKQYSNRFVLALGGGTLIQKTNQEALRTLPLETIFLHAEPHELWERCVDFVDAASRPLLKDFQFFKKLYAERLPLYEQAKWQVDTTGRPIPEVVTEIVARLGL